MISIIKTASELDENRYYGWSIHSSLYYEDNVVLGNELVPNQNDPFLLLDSASLSLYRIWLSATILSSALERMSGLRDISFSYNVGVLTCIIELTAGKQL